MAKIGSYAGIVFEVTEKKVLTFDNFERTTEPRWNDHQILQQKPVMEFEGPGTDKIIITISLKAELGINPEKQMAKIREFAKNGKTSLFVIGGKPISSNYWVIKKAVESHKSIDNRGKTMQIDVQLELAEYPKPVKIVQKKKKTVANTKKNTPSKKTLGQITITVKSVHIRSGPGVNYKVLGYAFRNNKLTVYSVNNGWYSLGGGKYITANSLYSKLKKA